MTPTPQINADGFPWWTLITLVIFLVLELTALVKHRTLYSGMVVNHLVDSFVRLVEELGEKDSEGKRKCGAVVAILVLAALVGIGYSVHGVLTHTDRPSLVFAVVLCIVLAAVILGFSLLNARYVAWVRKEH